MLLARKRTVRYGMNVMVVVVRILYLGAKPVDEAEICRALALVQIEVQQLALLKFHYLYFQLMTTSLKSIIMKPMPF